METVGTKQSGIRRIFNNVYIQYTIVFSIYVLGIFAVLIISHRSFMQFHDAYKQGAFRLIEMQNQFHNILSGEGFYFWSWYEGMGIDEPLEIFVDPFSFIGSLFPSRYLELGFTLAALLRMYFGGIAFLFVGRETGLKKEQNLIGAVLYVFSACFIGLALRQSEFLLNAYLFPLLVLGVDRIYKGKKPTVFILTIAYYMLISAYLAYMSAIVIIIYLCLRYFAYNDKFDIKDYFSYMGRFVLYGLTGILISAFSSIFAAFITLRASTDSSLEGEGLLFDKEFYLDFGKMLLGTGATYDYLDIGLPILIIILMPIAVRNIRKQSTNTIMAVILFAMLLLPFFGSMFNGFGYVTFRWSYTFVFFATWSAAEQIDSDVLMKKEVPWLACAGYAVIAIWTFVLYRMGMISLDHAGSRFVVVQLAAGAAIILSLVVMNKRKTGAGTATLVLLTISFLALSAGWMFGFRDNADKFARNASVYNNLNESTVRVSNQIKDKGFYRVDSVDGMSRHEDLMFPSNENVWWKSNNLFIYNSNIPKNLTEFNVELGNGYGYARRVFILSNENRAGLDFLCGVRYFLGNDDMKMGYERSDNYAGYGFEKSEVIDGVNVFKNKYDVDMGFVFGKALLKSDFDTLNRLEKEQALLQAVVVPDENSGSIKNIEWIKAEDLDIEIADVPFEVKNEDGLSFENGRITTDKDDASFTISVRNVPAGQMMVSFDNLLRNTDNGVDGGSYEIRAIDGRLKRKVMNNKSRQGVEGLRNHDINMGYFEGDDEITISFSKKGVYTFDDIYVSSMNMENFDKHAGVCMDNAFKTESYSDRNVQGSVNAKEDGVLFLSVPANDNWDIYVDGEKAETIENLDMAFFGAELSEGEHHIELKYNNTYVKYGSIGSLIGLVIMLVVIRKRKNYTDESGRTR